MSNVNRMEGAYETILDSQEGVTVKAKVLDVTENNHSRPAVSFGLQKKGRGMAMQFVKGSAEFIKADHLDLSKTGEAPERVRAHVLMNVTLEGTNTQEVQEAVRVWLQKALNRPETLQAALKASVLSSAATVAEIDNQGEEGLQELGSEALILLEDGPQLSA